MGLKTENFTDSNTSAKTAAGRGKKVLHKSELELNLEIEPDNETSNRAAARRAHLSFPIRCPLPGRSFVPPNVRNMR